MLPPSSPYMVGHMNCPSLRTYECPTTTTLWLLHVAKKSSCFSGFSLNSYEIRASLVLVGL